MASSAPREWVRAWKPSVPGITEVFHARFVDHAYPKHTHEDWTVFVVDDGGVRYDLERRTRGVGPSVVTVLPPHVVHDGRPATDAGFRKRVLYVSPEVLGLHLTGRAADTPDIHDRSLLTTLDRLHGSLQRPGEELEAEALMSLVAENLGGHLGDEAPSPSPLPEPAVAGILRDLLDADLVTPLTLDDASRTIGTSTPALVRAFTRTFGIPPHRYLIGRRIEIARKRLLAGEPVADTAVATGFYDQAHLTRHFRRHVGATPARFARSGPPDGYGRSR